MGKPSRDKGKRGEREAAAHWSALFGVPMRRSQQFCGRNDESDDIVGHDGLAIEVKRRNQLNVPLAVLQAAEDAAEGNLPLVLHRGDRQPWLVSLRLDDLPVLVTRLYLTLADQ